MRHTKGWSSEPLQYPQDSTHREVFLILQGNLHGFLPVVQRVFPGVEQEQQADLSCWVARQGILDGDEVLQRLGHLATFNGQVASVQEVAHPMVILVVGLKNKNTHRKCYNYNNKSVYTVQNLVRIDCFKRMSTHTHALARISIVIIQNLIYNLNK